VCKKQFSVTDLCDKPFSDNHESCGWSSDKEKTKLDTHSYYQEHFKNDEHINSGDDGTLHCENCNREGYHYPDDYDY